MTVTYIYDDRINWHLNLIVQDDHITVRTIGEIPLESVSAMSPAFELLGDMLWDYLGGLGRNFVRPWSWARSAHSDTAGSSGAGFSRAWTKGTPVGLAETTTLVERDSLTIQHDSKILGTGNDSDGTMWVWLADWDGKIKLMNRTLETLAGRCDPRMMYMQEGKLPILCMYQRYAGMKWTECDFIVFLNKEGKKNWTTFTTVDTNVTMDDYNSDPAKYEPVLAMDAAAPSTIKAGASAMIDLYIRDQTGQPDSKCASTVYLEAVSGFLPNCRAKMVQGHCQFRASALGMDVGENVHIKAGLRNWPGLVDVNLKVI